MSTPKNIAVVGAGVMGLSAAHALLKDGHKVTLFDPGGFPAANASAMAGGMLAPYSEIEHMPPAWIEAGLEGIRLWPGNGGDIHRNGSLLIAHDEDRYMLERFKTHLQGLSGWKAMNSQDIEMLEPRLAGRFDTGVYIHDEAHLNPRTTLARLCAMAVKSGAAFARKKADPKDLAKTYDHVIDCRGIGAEEDDKELRGVKGELATVRNPEFSLNRPVRLMHPRYPLYIVPRAENIFMIGATEIQSTPEDTNSECRASVRAVLELLSAAYSLHASFAEAEIMTISAGIRPAYNNNLPRLHETGNIIRCNGLFRHGFLLAPVMAKSVARMIEGRAYEYISLLKGEDNEHRAERTKKDDRPGAQQAA